MILNNFEKHFKKLKSKKSYLLLEKIKNVKIYLFFNFE